ncbi:phage tail assembly chaperone [uncultured Bradyrhizobium sp.]|uniref:phage tail assembly chaperone n=1 Tax=uncultured Bradyrhizobium sp. TaxID=199684 RepID=UPI0035CA740B
MSTIHIHYKPIDDRYGEIGGWETNDVPTIEDGWLIATILLAKGQSVPDGKTQKLDFIDKIIVEKTEAEKREALVPSAWEMKCRIFAELNATDQFVVPDRPMSEECRESWSTYRQALRDLSKLSGVRAMIGAWPVRPDDIDAASELRERT